MVFLKKLWRGEFSLATTYWLFGVLGNVLFGCAIALAPLLSPGYLYQAILVASIFYAIFISVAIWNAASNYGGSSIWKFLAKTIVLIPVVAAFFQLGPFFTKSAERYASISECRFKELIANTSQNIGVAINTINDYCDVVVFDNLNLNLGLAIDQKKLIDIGATQQQIAQAAFTISLEKRKYPVREKFTNLPECVYGLSKGYSSSKEKEVVVNKFAGDYCAELVALNLGLSANFDIAKALKEGYSFAEIASHLQKK